MSTNVRMTTRLAYGGDLWLVEADDGLWWTLTDSSADSLIFNHFTNRVKPMSRLGRSLRLRVHFAEQDRMNGDEP